MVRSGSFGAAALAALLASVLAGLLASCSFSSVDLVPLAGPAPQRVTVWPGVGGDLGPVSGTLLYGLDEALRRRGYRVVAQRVARQMLVDAGVPSPESVLPERTDLGAIGRELAVDAVVLVDVRDFEVEPRSGDLRHARWDLSWRILSTRDGAELWRYHHGGAWSRSSEQRFDSLERPEPMPGVVPIGGDAGWSFRDAADLAANLHRLALAHLPPLDRSRRR